MNKILFSLLFFIGSIVSSYAQIHYGAQGYTEYRRGSIPIIISVPHGGLLSPDSIPDRTCNNPTTVTDANTIELSLRIDSSFYERTGCHIHLVICNLKRTKVDCNRNLSDGACNHPEAIKAWSDFHQFIDSAQTLAVNEFNKAFYIDLHGHGKALQRLELGYLLSDNALELSDSILNTNTYINKSSLKELVQNNNSNSTHAELLRGELALGTFLCNAGFPSVPSKQIPKPDTTTNYFDGGYNTENYTSKTPGKIVNGLQIECNNVGVRNTAQNRRKFADSLVSVLINYLSIHQNYQFNNCINSGLYRNIEFNFDIIPNPVTDKFVLKNNAEYKVTQINLFDTQGRLIRTYTNPIYSTTDFTIEGIENGVYSLRVITSEGMYSIKILIAR